MTSAASRQRVVTPPSATGSRAVDARQADAPDLVSIYAERLRSAAEAPPLFTPQPVLRIGRGTPGFRRRRPAAMPGSGRRGVEPPRRLTRRGRRVTAAAMVVTIVTTALAGTALAS